MFTSLIDILDSRPTLRADIEAAGLTVDEWYNQHGVNEYPGVTLVEPGDPRIIDPKTLTAEAQQQGVPQTPVQPPGTEPVGSPTEQPSSGGFQTTQGGDTILVSGI